MEGSVKLLHSHWAASQQQQGLRQTVLVVWFTSQLNLFNICISSRMKSMFQCLWKSSVEIKLHTFRAAFYCDQSNFESVKSQKKCNNVRESAKMAEKVSKSAKMWHINLYISIFQLFSLLWCLDYSKKRSGRDSLCLLSSRDWKQRPVPYRFMSDRSCDNSPVVTKQKLEGQFECRWAAEMFQTGSSRSWVQTTCFTFGFMWFNV